MWTSTHDYNFHERPPCPLQNESRSMRLKNVSQHFLFSLEFEVASV